MFDSRRDDTEHRSGKESHVYVEKLIRSSREIMIVTPYLDAYYASFLRSNARKKRIRIISSSIDADAEKILHKKRHTLSFLIIAAIAVIMSAAYYALGQLTLVSGAAAAFLILASGVLMLGPGNSIPVRKPKDFVHAKMYIGDDYAITGSANLTFKGMHENYEHITIVRKPETLKELRWEFEKMWSTST